MFKQVIGHCSFVGHTGYNEHAREFFTSLNKHIPVKIHNYAYCDDLSYLTDEQRSMLILTPDGNTSWGTTQFPQTSDQNTLNIVLLETNHYYFYDNYQSPTIFYTVWELPKYPKQFFERLKQCDRLWLPTECHKQWAVEQGYDESKIDIIHEGVGKEFIPLQHPPKLDKFRYIFAGRWDTRKNIENTIRAFLKVFENNNEVELWLSADNPFGKGTTEEKLKQHGFESNKIKVVHFPPRQEYIKTLQEGHVFLSASLCEGWHLPLIQAAACGIPTIMTDYGPPLEYAKGIAHLVRVKEYTKPTNMFNVDLNEDLGMWAEPDFDHLVDVIRDVYENYSNYKDKAVKDSVIIREKFSWEKSAKIAHDCIKDMGKEVTYTPNVSKFEDGMELYQDQYVNGDIVEKGVTDCASRYEVLKQIFSKYNRPFTILDVGANFGYYSLRACTEFDASAVLIESEDKEINRLIELAEKNHCGNKLIILKTRLNLEKLTELSKCEHFDVILGLNILHHFNNDELLKVCELFTLLGDNLIIEVPPIGDKNACGQSNIESIHQYFDNINKDSLGFFRRHTSSEKSEMFWIETPKKEITSTYYKYDDLIDKDIVPKHLQHLLIKQPYQIFSDFDTKTIYNNRHGKVTDWINGINLKTYLELNGVFPRRNEIIKKMKAKEVNTEYKWDDTNNDLVVHNFLINGSKLYLIDFDDEYVEVTNNIPDDESINSIITFISTPWLVEEKTKYLVKLNLGCGNDFKEGYINVDKFNGESDEQWDILDMPIEGNYADEIFVSHVLEHFPIRETPVALMEWSRVLKIGGKLIIKVPDFEAGVKVWQNSNDKWSALLFAIYGGQSHEGNYHFAGFTVDTLREIVSSFNFDVHKCESDGSELVLEGVKTKNFVIPGTNVTCHFVDGPYLKFNGEGGHYYSVEFNDTDTGSQVHSDVLKQNHWTRPFRKWYTNWNVSLSFGRKKIFNHKFDLNNKRVLITLDSKSLGDNLCWVPYVDEFRKKHDCKVIVSSFWNNLYQKEYPELDFVEPGNSIDNLYASYTVGCYDGDVYKNKNDWRSIPLQQIASDMLGLEYKEIKPNITVPDKKRNIDGKYVCISQHSTMQAKYWNYPNGWQEITEYLKSKGYKVVDIAKESGEYMGNPLLKGVIDKTGDVPIEDRIVDLKYADMFIGIGSGLGWLSWAVNTPVVMISGFSDFCEFTSGNSRITAQGDVCHGCFNDVNIKFDRGTWDWCPRDRDFECSKSITPERVIEEINKII